jgi:3-dehydroquinate dehydratase
VTAENMSAEEVLAHLQEQASRGADILKIVVKTDTEESAVEAIRTMLLLNKEIDRPYVFLGGGKYGRFVRYNGLKLGVAIQFGVHSYEAEMLYNQPTLRSFKGVRENFQWDICNQPE